MSSPFTPVGGEMRRRNRGKLPKSGDSSTATLKPGEGERKFYERGFNGSRWIKEITCFFEPARLVLMELKERLKIFVKRAALKSRADYKEILRELTLLDFFLGLFGVVSILSASLVFLSGFCLLGYQSFLWLKDGTWTEFPLLVVFDYLFPGTALQAWLNDPGSWYGLHQVAVWVMENIPLSLTLIMDGVLMSLFLVVIMMMAVFLRYQQIKKL